VNDFYNDFHHSIFTFPGSSFIQKTFFLYQKQLNQFINKKFLGIVFSYSTIHKKCRFTLINFEKEFAGGFYSSGSISMI